MLSRLGSPLLTLLLVACVSSQPRGFNNTDPCDEFSPSCGDCIAAGCRFCPLDGSCTSSDVEFLLLCSEQDDEFVVSGGSCDVNDLYRPEYDGNDVDDKPFFSDPNYLGNAWAFKMINVLPVWREGITGKGVRVRVNVGAVNHEHAEFGGRFDEDASCEDGFNFTAGQDQATFIASFLGAEANNGQCSVGIAPKVSLSACDPFSDNTTTFNLDTKLDKLDIMMTGIVANGCNVDDSLLIDYRRRHLQSQTCPFDASLIGTGDFKNPCKVCDFSVDSLLDLSQECKRSISLHCRRDDFLAEDALACRAYIDVHADDGHRCGYLPVEGSAASRFIEAIEKGIKEGRDGKGVIHVFLVPQAALYGSNSNANPFTIIRHTISVASVQQDGKAAPDTAGGASLLVSAPGGSLLDGFDALSDMVGAGSGSGTDCQSFGTTASSSYTIVAGVLALVLEANPDLTWRDVRGILTETSRVPGHKNKNDMETGTAVSSGSGLPVIINGVQDTITNAAGFTHSYRYGFGIIDAHAAVTAAKTWVSYGEELNMTATNEEAVDIPDNRDTVSSVVMLDRGSISGVGAGEDFFVEHVDVLLDLNHSSRGDLDIMLTSPSGTVSHLLSGGRNENREYDTVWQISTVRSRGESPFGEWKLEIRDISEGEYKNCVDQNWTVPAIEDGCPFIEGYRNGCNTYGSLDSAQRTTPDINSMTANQACCSCGGGVQQEDGSCEDLPWQLIIESRQGCDPLRLYRAYGCTDGPYLESMIDTEFVAGEGTAREACCYCGGGKDEVREYESTFQLEKWDLVVYGHVVPSSGAPVASPTVDAPDNAAADGCQGSDLTKGHRLYPGEYMCMGDIKFGLTHEGKVACAKGDHNTELSDPAHYMEMQPDGNLVAYNNGHPVFFTDTHGEHGAALIVRDTRAIVYKDGVPSSDPLESDKKLWQYDCSM